MLDAVSVSQAKAKYTRYASLLSILYYSLTGCASVATALISALSADPSHSELKRLTQVGLGVFSTCVITMLHATSMSETIKSCESISTLLTLYTSGMVTTPDELAKIEHTLQHRIHTTRVLCFSHPELQDTTDLSTF